MSKIIILGSAGMAGHIISKYLKSTNNYEIIDIARNSLFCPVKYQIDIEKDLEYLNDIIELEAPYVIINCIGLLVKDSNTRPDKTIYINSYFPHWLEEITRDTTTKIIHLSTNCVFKEDKGNYLDTDIPDGDTWYARTKAIGEIINNKDLTIRLSIIGDELKNNGSGLFSWFMRQKETVSGYSKCYWNGITTLCLAQNIEKMIEANVTGLYQLAPNYKIDKYSLLQLFKQIWDKQDIIILQNDSMVKDGTLVNSYRGNFHPIFLMNYKYMLKELYEFIQ